MVENTKSVIQIAKSAILANSFYHFIPLFRTILRENVTEKVSCRSLQGVVFLQILTVKRCRFLADLKIVLEPFESRRNIALNIYSILNNLINNRESKTIATVWIWISQSSFILLIAILIYGGILQDITLRLIKSSGTALAALFVVIWHMIGI